MLSNNQRKAVLDSIEPVHSAYAALDFLQTEKMITGADTSSTLNALIVSRFSVLRKDNPRDESTVKINNRDFKIYLSLQEDGTVACTVKEIGKINLSPGFKAVESYVEDEKLNLICQHEIIYAKNSKGDFVPGLKIRKNKQEVLDIGGPGKIDLYRDHLSVLFNIHQHISRGDHSSILIALATGAGKTFVQALWFLVLYIADVNGIFALPNKLLAQFQGDLRKLLPEEVVDKAIILSETSQNDEAEKALQKLATQQQDEPVKFIIASYEELLDKYYESIKKAKNSVISFDEQHLIMDQEIRKIKLKEIAKNKLAMFLTATPNEETYKLCNRKPVAYMSSKEKEKAGHGQFPKIRERKAKNFDDRAASLPTYPLTLSDRLYKSIVDSIEPQRSSAILSLFESFQADVAEQYKIDPNGGMDRWNYQPPLARKVLTIVDNNDELINLDNFILNTDEFGDQLPVKIKICDRKPRNMKANHLYFYKCPTFNQWLYAIRYHFPNPLQEGFVRYINDSSQKIIEILDNAQLSENLPLSDERIIISLLEKANLFVSMESKQKSMPVYQNGNLLDRQLVYKFLDREKQSVDKKIDYAVTEQKKRVLEGEVKYPAAVQLDYVIFAGIIDYVLCDITGLSLIELNIQRKNNPQNIDAIAQALDVLIREDIVEKYKAKLTFSNNNKNGIDAAGAEQIAKIINEILIQYAALKDNLNLPNKSFYNLFIENSPLENTARDEILKNKELKKLFEAYVREHRTIYLMTGMEESETRIEDSRPFSGYDVKMVQLRGSDGAKSTDAKARDHSALEDMGPYMLEYQYTPRYLDGVTETIADNYFKLGFIGMYVSNKKTEGFSDLNLHTVVSAVPDRADTNNDPSKEIQGIGRLRGKDPTQVPHYFSVTGRDTDLTFDLKALNREDDYYPQFFSAKKQYNEKSLRQIGKNLAKKIRSHLHVCLNAYDEIDNDKYYDGVQLLLLAAFRNIYNKNSHNLKLSRRQLQTVLRYVKDELHEQMGQLKKSQKMRKATAAIAIIVDKLHKFTFWVKARELRKRFGSIASKVSRDVSFRVYDRTYVNIIQKSEFIVLMEMESVFLSFMNLLNKKESYIEKNIKYDLLSRMNQVDKAQYNDAFKRFLLPLLVKFINPEKQAYCLEQASKFNDWVSVLVVEEKLINEFNNAKLEKKAEIAISIFQKVPTLRHYLSVRNDKFLYSKEFAEEKMTLVELEVKNIIESNIVVDLKKYLSEDFLVNLRPFFVADDYSIISEILSAESNARAFAEHMIKHRDTNFNDDAGNFDTKKALAFFVEYFQHNYPSLRSIRNIEERGNEASEEIMRVVDRINRDLSQNLSSVLSKRSFVEAARLLKADEIEFLNKQCHDELLPGMLKFFKPEMQNILLRRLNSFDKWHEVLFQFSEEFKQFSGHEEELVQLFIKILNVAIQDESLNLPAYQRNYERACKHTASEIADDLNNMISPKNIAANVLTVSAGFFGALFKGRSIAESAEAAGEKLLSRYISEQLAEKLEPFFYENDYLALKSLFSNEKTATALAGYMIKQKNAGALSNNLSDPRQMFTIFSQFFAEYENAKYVGVINNLKLAADRLKVSADVLQEKAKKYADELQNIDEQGEPKLFTKHPSYAASVINAGHEAPKAAINNVAIKHLLPLLLCCIKDGEHSRVAAAFTNCKLLPGLLAEMRDDLRDLNGDNATQITFELLNKIPELKDTLSIAEHGISMRSCHDPLQKNMNDLANLRAPFNTAAILELTNYFKEKLPNKLRYLMAESDWLRFCKILENKKDRKKLAESLIELSVKDGNMKEDSLRDIIKEIFSNHPHYIKMNRDSNNRIMFLNHLSEETTTQLDMLKQKLKDIYKSLEDKNKEPYFEVEIRSVIKMDEFREMILGMAGHLKETDIDALLQLFDQRKNTLPEPLKSHPNLKSLKDKLISFIQFVRDNNQEGLYDQIIRSNFLQLIDARANEQNTNNNELLMLFALLHQINNEQICCHQYFANVSSPSSTQNGEQKSSLLADELYDANLKYCRGEFDVFHEAFAMFELIAMKSSMRVNSKISLEINRKLYELVQLTSEEFVTPLLELMEGEQPCVTKPIGVSAVELGEHICRLTPMNLSDITSGSLSKDAVDPLVNHVTQLHANSRLADWWIGRQGTKYMKDLNHFVQYCDINSNASLRQGYILSTYYLRNTNNFSDQFKLVHQLRRRIYGYMSLNTYNEIIKTQPGYYDALLNNITNYLEAVAQQPLHEHTFVSTTFNKMKSILLNEKISSLDKLIRIQFLARDHRSNTFHNVKRCVSHFFSQKKSEEGKWVSQFCERLGRTSFADKQGFEKINEFFLTPRHENDLSKVVIKV